MEKLMNLIVEETGECIPIPEDSYMLFQKQPSLIMPHMTDVSIHEQQFMDKTSLCTTHMRLKRGDVYITHGYDLRDVLEFLYGQRPTTPGLETELRKRAPHIRTDRLKINNLAVSKEEAGCTKLEIEAYIL